MTDKQSSSASSTKLTVWLLDYGAGNVASVRNALTSLGNIELRDIQQASDLEQATIVVFPGVGAFPSAMEELERRQLIQPVRDYLQEAATKQSSTEQQKYFLGICLGMQTLFESSEEVLGHSPLSLTTNKDNGDETTATATTANEIPGLGVIPGKVRKFDDSQRKVPHMGWNGLVLHQTSPVFDYVSDKKNDTTGTPTIVVDQDAYFVHSYYAPVLEENRSYILTSTNYAGQEFISSVQKNGLVATQFHPEKSGNLGLSFLKGFLQSIRDGTLTSAQPLDMDKVTSSTTAPRTTTLAKRIVVALDVRTNDDGDLVVTKGDQYDVREKEDNKDTSTATERRRGVVRNLGKPVSLAERYYRGGADEIAFLNITSFRQGVIDDMPMLQVLEAASRNIFVPLTVGGGIRSYTDPVSNQTWSALEVASRYFRAGADKVSLGSDAVQAAENYLASGKVKSGETSIEKISRVYGAQAVVISIDPKRVYVASPDTVDPKHVVVELSDNDGTGPNGERYCWYQCTVKGGRETRDICAVTVATACEALGAGEIMLNCIDMDGQGKGYDIPLMKAVSQAVSIPVIASSGAGNPQHFTDVFQATNVSAALAAGMFHRQEVEIEAVRQHMKDNGIPSRRKCLE